MQLVFQLQFFFKSPISFFNCCLFQRIWILLYTKVILRTYVWALIKVLDKTILNTICGQFTRCKRESIFLWKWILWCYRITSCRFCSFLLILQKWFQVFFQLTVYLVSSIFDCLWSYEWKKIILVFFFLFFLHLILLHVNILLSVIKIFKIIKQYFISHLSSFLFIFLKLCNLL
jgi:hypothetical protein